MRTRPFGTDAVLVEVEDAAAARSLASWARRVGVVAADIVPGAASVLFDGIPEPESLVELLAGWNSDVEPPAGELVEVPVTYDGADLGFVADRWGMSEAAAVELHASIEYVAAFCGFAPGFSYLEGLPEDRAVPRLESPRTKVRAGSVGLAGAWCGVYPTASPGGWRILGTTTVSLWDATREKPALLAPGTRVRFVPQ